MGLLSKLFGPKPPRPQEEIRADIEALIQEIDNLALTDPKTAGKRLLKRAASDIETMIDFGAPCHREYAEVVLKLIARLEILAGKTGAEIAVDDLPSVLVVSDKETTTFGEIVQAARASDREVIHVRGFLQFDKRGDWLDTLLAVEGLCEFVADPATQLMCLAEDFFMVRRAFLLQLADLVDAATTYKQLPRTMGETLEKMDGLTEDFITTPNEYEVAKYARP